MSSSSNSLQYSTTRLSSYSPKVILLNSNSSNQEPVENVLESRSGTGIALVSYKPLRWRVRRTKNPGSQLARQVVKNP
ncbi:hypothetical protein Sjap_020222 [Stephania japonica]|uniref:Uncharacterized protein n=1 Tax=Stephania japonica TaxID=461633 RepID=A0AAP0F7P1_9MAGN